jgi:hypothetical protein
MSQFLRIPLRYPARDLSRPAERQTQAPPPFLPRLRSLKAKVLPQSLRPLERPMIMTEIQPLKPQLHLSFDVHSVLNFEVLWHCSSEFIYEAMDLHFNSG